MSVPGATWMHRSEAFAEDLLGLGALDGLDAGEATLAPARRPPWWQRIWRLPLTRRAGRLAAARPLAARAGV